MEKCVVVWFRKDLRIVDHEPLYRASCERLPILPIYIFDPQQFTQTAYGFPKTGLHRVRFLLESLDGLHQQLQARGLSLCTRWGSPEEVFQQLRNQYNFTQIFYSTALGSEEEAQVQRVEQAMGQHVSLHACWTHTLLTPETLPFPISQVPDVFTVFRQQVERQWTVREAWPNLAYGLSLQNPPESVTPSLAKLGFASDQHTLPDPRTVFPFRGGPAAAEARLRAYLDETHAIRTYKQTRNGLLGTDYSSKFSPYLSLGSLSPRMIYEKIKAYEREWGGNDSTYWLVFELLWRDYFVFVHRKYGNRIFQKHGIQGHDVLSRDKLAGHVFNPKQHADWMEGNTGEPFVDANMKELRLTGFMSNRGRQVTASYYVSVLHQDWRVGAAWFESCLIDYDVSSNYGNWMYVAGVGNDPRPNRFFHPVKQARMYDPQGEYVKQWLT